MIEYIKLGASAIITAASIICSIIIAKKKGKNAKLYQIVQKIPNLICEAEKTLGGGTGPAKLRYVLRELQIACLEEHIKYNEEQLKNEIENVLQTPTKKTRKTTTFNKAPEIWNDYFKEEENKQQEKK